MTDPGGGISYSRQSTLSPPRSISNKSLSSMSPHPTEHDKSMPSTPPHPTEHDEGIPEVLKISRSKGAHILEKYYMENSGGMFFRDSAEASATVDQAQWHPPSDDKTIPQNLQEDQLVVRRLVEALLDTNNAMDTEGNAYRKRFTPGTTVFYDPWTIECCAWHVLKLVKAIHTDGFRAPIFDVDILKAIGQTERWTFADRISMICRVLKTSKSVAVTLMKHEKTWTIVGAPHKLYNSTLVNTQSNAFRNKWVKAGRQAEKGAADPNQPVPKRKRVNKVPTSRKTPPVKPAPVLLPKVVSYEFLTPRTPPALNNDGTSFNNINNVNNNIGAYASTSPFSLSSSPFSISSSPFALSSSPFSLSTLQALADNDIEMVDTITHQPKKDITDKFNVDTEAVLKDNTAAHAKLKNDFLIAKQAAQDAFKENNAAAADIPMDEAEAKYVPPTSPARLAADFDAAQVLLGLRTA